MKIVLEFLGINHTMVSIYESGSNDKSRLLLNIFALELENIVISNFFQLLINNWKYIKKKLKYYYKNFLIKINIFL